MKQKKVIAILIITAFLITLVVVLAILFAPQRTFSASEATMAKVHACLQDWTDECGIVFADEKAPRYCLQLMSVGEKDNCFDAVANARAEPLFCENIADEGKRNTCKVIVSSFQRPII